MRFYLLKEQVDQLQAQGLVYEGRAWRGASYLYWRNSQTYDTYRLRRSKNPKVYFCDLGKLKTLRVAKRDLGIAYNEFAPRQLVFSKNEFVYI